LGRSWLKISQDKTLARLHLNKQAGHGGLLSQLHKKYGEEDQGPQEQSTRTFLKIKKAKEGWGLS
jgi:hypothetical protein